MHTTAGAVGGNRCATFRFGASSEGGPGESRNGAERKDFSSPRKVGGARKVTEPWEGLNPRSKVAAPVVISSDNVQLVRNILQNPESRYELGSQLIEPNTAPFFEPKWAWKSTCYRL